VKWFLGAFGLIAGAAIVAAVANYGYTTSDTQTAGEITAFLYAVIAIGGIAGPAVALHIFRLSKLWGLIAGVVGLAALLVNLSNSLGAIAGRSDKTLATRIAATDARREAQRELDRVTTERATLHPVGTTQDAVAAAREAVQVTEMRQAAECTDGVGKRCRERGDAVQVAQEALAKVLRDRGETDRADRLDAKAAELRARLDKAPAVATVNPQATLLGRLFRLPDADAMTGQQVATAIVVELLIALSLIGFELSGTRRPATLVTETSAPVERPRTIAGVALVKDAKATATDKDVARFMLACLPRARGAEAEMSTVYARYCRWCEEQSPALRPHDKLGFALAIKAWCECGKIDVRRDGGRVYCVDVKLAS
jgi:hypothetical protein